MVPTRSLSEPITVVTGWSPEGYESYGKAFLDSFYRHWPESIALIVYTEQPMFLNRGENRLIWDIPGCERFLRDYDTPLARGREPFERWKDKERRQGYSFRFDAWKFCRQGFIAAHAAQSLEGIMVWLDGDVITFRDIPEGFIESLTVGDVNYLGRPKHSEIGFVSYRLPQARPLAERFGEYYRSGEVFDLKEWHSAYVFDRSREDTGVLGHNLTPGGRGDVWSVSPLAEYTHHYKGNRKRLIPC